MTPPACMAGGRSARTSRGWRGAGRGRGARRRPRTIRARCGWRGLAADRGGPDSRCAAVGIDQSRGEKRASRARREEDAVPMGERCKRQRVAEKEKKREEKGVGFPVFVRRWNEQERSRADEEGAREARHDAGSSFADACAAHVTRISTNVVCVFVCRRGTGTSPRSVACVPIHPPAVSVSAASSGFQRPCSRRDSGRGRCRPGGRPLQRAANESARASSARPRPAARRMRRASRCHHVRVSSSGQATRLRRMLLEYGGYMQAGRRPNGVGRGAEECRRRADEPTEDKSQNDDARRKTKDKRRQRRQFDRDNRADGRQGTATREQDNHSRRRAVGAGRHRPATAPRHGKHLDATRPPSRRSRLSRPGRARPAGSPGCCRRRPPGCQPRRRHPRRRRPASS